MRACARVTEAPPAVPTGAESQRGTGLESTAWPTRRSRVPRPRPASAFRQPRGCMAGLVLRLEVARCVRHGPPVGATRVGAGGQPRRLGGAAGQVRERGRPYAPDPEDRPNA